MFPKLCGVINRPSASTANQEPVLLQTWVGIWASAFDEPAGSTRHNLCLESLEKIEQSDYAYRDTFRAFTLVTLGVIALDQDDKPAAQAAFHQAVAHIKGRPNTLAGGWLMVRALAGMACSTGDPAYYHEASTGLEQKKAFDFSWLWQCTDREARADLSHAASVLGVSAQDDSH